MPELKQCKCGAAIPSEQEMCRYCHMKRPPAASPPATTPTPTASTRQLALALALLGVRELGPRPPIVSRRNKNR